MASIKAATIENIDRKNDVCETGLPSPPVPVITQWATWLRAALYYSENLPAVRTIVNNWIGEGLLVSRAKKAINVDGLVVPDLVCLNQYRTVATNAELLEASDCTMTEVYELLKNMHFLDDPCSIQAYIKKRLSHSDLETIINCTNLAIAPTTRPGARIAWLGGGAEINFGGHEKFVYEDSRGARGHEKFVYEDSRGAREIYSNVDQTKKVKTKKKSYSVQKFPQILVILLSSQNSCDFPRILTWRTKKKKKGFRPKSFLKSGVSPQKLRKYER